MKDQRQQSKSKQRQKSPPRHSRLRSQTKKKSELGLSQKKTRKFELDPQSRSPIARTELSILFRVVQQYYATFQEERNQEGRPLPGYIKKEFEGFLQCGVLANGFVHLKCDNCKEDRLVPFSCKRRGFCPSCTGRRMCESSAFYVDHVLPIAPFRQWVVSFPIPLRYWMAKNPKLVTQILAIITRAIGRYYKKKNKDGVLCPNAKVAIATLTVVQRFGGSCNLNIHFHSLWAEGVFEEQPNTSVKFHVASPPSDQEVAEVLRRIHTRVLRFLSRKGYLEIVDRYGKPEIEIKETQEQAELDIIATCQEASVLSRIGTGSHAGERVKRIGSFGMLGDDPMSEGPRCATLAGFSVHANTAFQTGERNELEKLCRYLTRPPIAESRLSLTREGKVIYRFKADILRAE